jgi:hypothetical protein
MKGTGVGGIVGGVPFTGLEGIPYLRNNIRVCSDAAKAKTECRFVLFILCLHTLLPFVKYGYCCCWCCQQLQD